MDNMAFGACGGNQTSYLGVTGWEMIRLLIFLYDGRRDAGFGITCNPSNASRTIWVQGLPSELRLGFVDLDYGCSTVCSTLLGLMGIWQKRLGSWARWWNTEIKVNLTQVSAHLVHPVESIVLNLPYLTFTLMLRCR